MSFGSSHGLPSVWANPPRPQGGFPPCQATLLRAEVELTPRAPHHQYGKHVLSDLRPRVMGHYTSR